MIKNEYSVYDVLATLETRPGMYMSDITLNHFMTYLFGYEMAMRNVGIKDMSKPKFQGFHEFVKEKYGYFESTAGWANMILAATIGLSPKNIRWENYDINVTREQHLESIKTFYSLINEYRQKTSRL